MDALADAIVKIGGVSAEEQAAMAKAGKEMVFAEHRTLTITLTLTLTQP